MSIIRAKQKTSFCCRYELLKYVAVEYAERNKLISCLFYMANGCNWERRNYQFTTEASVMYCVNKNAANDSIEHSIN